MNSNKILIFSTMLFTIIGSLQAMQSKSNISQIQLNDNLNNILLNNKNSQNLNNINNINNDNQKINHEQSKQHDDMQYNIKLLRQNLQEPNNNVNNNSFDGLLTLCNYLYMNNMQHKEIIDNFIQRFDFKTNHVFSLLNRNEQINIQMFLVHNKILDNQNQILKRCEIIVKKLDDNTTKINRLDIKISQIEDNINNIINKLNKIYEQMDTNNNKIEKRINTINNISNELYDKIDTNNSKIEDKLYDINHTLNATYERIITNNGQLNPDIGTRLLDEIYKEVRNIRDAQIQIQRGVDKKYVGKMLETKENLTKTTKNYK